jgi:von Willebrand factor type A domain
MRSRFRQLLPVFLALVTVPALLAQGGVNKSLFVSVLDENGRPVRQFTADDVLIREDGQDRAVVEVKPASQPISVAFLVDTAQGSRVQDHYGTTEEYVRDMRVATSAFAHQLLTLAPDAQVSLMEFGQAAVTMVKYSSDLTEFDKGVNKLVSRPGVGSVLGEALEAANKDLAQRPSTRRAIVSINFEPSDERSFENATPIKDAFRKSGAQLWALSVHRGELKNAGRDIVLNDFAKQTGGQRDFIVDISAMENILKAYANALAMQYEVVYKRPENAKTVKVVQVGTRQGLKVHASGFAPQ